MESGNLQSRIGTFRKVVRNNLVSKGFFSKKTGKRFVILMYHGIDQKQDTRYNQRFFSKKNFEKQIQSFKRHLNILTYDDLLNGRFSSVKTNALITFDDGYANNYHYALPVLEKYDAHALFFVTGVGTLPVKVLWADALDIVCRHAHQRDKVVIQNTDFFYSQGDFISSDNVSVKKYIKESGLAGYSEKQTLVAQLLRIYDFTRENGLDDYWQLMTDEQICKAAQSKNITIGSHGFYHNNLGSLSLADAVAEVAQSRTYLEGITQKKLSSIAFPDGSYTEELNDSLFDAGFVKQFVVNYNFGDGGKRDFAYDRIGLYPYMGNNHQIMHKFLHS